MDRPEWTTLTGVYATYLAMKLWDRKGDGEWADRLDQVTPGHHLIGSVFVYVNHMKIE